jgi:hypothetical protein
VWQTIWTTLSDLNWTTIAGVVGSVAPLITILIAYRALGSWKRTLQNQRIDECISGAYDLIGSADRFITTKRRGRSSAIEETFDQLLASWHDFNRAYRLARRYRADLDPNATFEIQKLLSGLDYEPEFQRLTDAMRRRLYDIIEKLEAK